MLEVVAAVAGAVGAERTGLRLSPYNSFLSAQDSVEAAIEKNVWLMKELDNRVPGLAYIHMVRVSLGVVLGWSTTSRTLASYLSTNCNRVQCLVTYD
jgi:2,4-dienoyl-CoA reductase-like NADH-dependent reductase (Old Yellow Enzyme family)